MFNVERNCIVNAMTVIVQNFLSHAKNAESADYLFINVNRSKGLFKVVLIGKLLICLPTIVNRSILIFL